MATEAIGREHELVVVQSFLTAAEQGPTALVLSGEPGIGKTILWEAAIERARERFGRVLLCRGVEAEAGFAFAGLSELLAGVLEEVAPSLLPPRRRALEVALLLVEPGEETTDAHGIGLALLDVLRLVAGERPLVVAVDDLQWLDVSSAAVLQIALRRLRDERVGFLATLRTAPGVSAPFALERSFSDDRLSRLSLDPLSLGSLHHLLRDRLALELTRPELSRVLETSGGNPFFALELGRELARTDTRPAPGRALQIPESLHELLGGRLARLPAETVDVLLQAAALARPTVAIMARAHGDLERVRGALDEAVRERVVELDDPSLRFAHPLLASICYEQAPPWKRRAVHGALAGAVTDLEERARHLALAAEGPDASVAAELEAAAEQAGGRGATAAAAELSELAAESTPDDPGPARQRWLRAADFHRLAGDPERATALLEQLLTEVPSGVERADILLVLISMLSPGRSMVERCDAALAEAGGDDARAARILGFRSWGYLLEGDVGTALADARGALEAAERAGDPVLIAVAIGRIGQAEMWAGEVTPGLLERGTEIEERLGLSLEFMESPHVMLARLLMRRGELDRAHVILEELEARAAARGDEFTRVLIMWFLSTVEWLAGNLQGALERAAAADELADQTQFPHRRAWAGRARALVEADLGLVEEARATAEKALEWSQARSDEIWDVYSLGVLGRLELVLGDLEAAAGRVRDLPGRFRAAGWHDPTVPAWPDALETLVALGELAEARDHLESYEAHAQGLGSPWARAAAARCLGLLRAAEGDLDGAFAAFDQALAQLDTHPFPLERGRTLLCLGVVRRQAGQRKAARGVLEQALGIFDGLGAGLWADKTRNELRRISGRRAAAEELTETERRVAELAAQGRSNKEIAAELFIGASTVEMHLSRVYRKLGVRRSELGGRLAIPPDDSPNPVGRTPQT
jgi:DNA-binding CsgD family transcriptional regulator